MFELSILIDLDSQQLGQAQKTGRCCFCDYLYQWPEGVECDRMKFMACEFSLFHFERYLQAGEIYAKFFLMGFDPNEDFFPSYAPTRAI